MHITQFSYLPQASVCCVLCQVLSFHWWVVPVLLVCRPELRYPHHSRSHTAVRLNSWCDNCESIEGKITKLLGMANSRGWENSFIAHFQGCRLMEKSSLCKQISA